MDLQKFLQRQRVQTWAILSLLTPTQSYFVDRMSKFVIRASDNTGSTSSDHELQDAWQKNEHNLTKSVEKMFSSEDRVDNSLLNLFRIMIASRYGKNIVAEGIREAHAQNQVDDDSDDRVGVDQTNVEVE